MSSSALPSESDYPLSLVPTSPELLQPAVYPLHHSLPTPVSRRLSISWSRGNSLRVSFFRQNHFSEAEGQTNGFSDEDEVGGRVLEVKLGGGGNGEIDEAQWRRIAYGSVSPFALLQSRKNSVSALSKMTIPQLSNVEWWEYLMEYSEEISSLLGNTKLSLGSMIDDPKTILKAVDEPTSLKASWELLQIFYADQQSQAWLPERLVDWMADYDRLFSETQNTVHSKLVNVQNDIVYLQAVEDDPKYWEGISSALAVGWLDIVVKLLRLHGSYELDQLGCRETENGLVEAVAVLISKMPRLRPALAPGILGESYKNKPDFVKVWEKWRTQITKLDCSSFWVQCEHQPTREGLRSMLHIMLGNLDSLAAATCNWMELFVSHFLYIRPFTVGMESMYSLAQKCIQLKPVNGHHSLMRLMIGILGENVEVVLAECSKAYGPWMVAHAIELMTTGTGSDQSESFLLEEHHNLGGVSIEELHRILYSQVLASHALTWQIAPAYLMSCVKQGKDLLEILLLGQPVQYNQALVKSIEICRLYELQSISSKLMKIAGMYHWKHGRKGYGIFWLQQAQDEFRLNKIAQQLLDFVGKSISDESFKQWEGLIELLGSDTKAAGGLEFLHRYRDFKKSLLQVYDGKATDAAKQAVESLIMLMKNPSTPPRFWLPLLYDSLKLLTWHEGPLLDFSQTSLLLNKLQELSMERLRPDFVEPDLPSQALSSVRLALATNLGRAILEE